ncbi:DUF3343 domain-containing protein [Phosphitispora sp. TUW77]|uniref:DUF3343 domain-containing protein n=1 Tax=Phosphitispora sp. TUW77 TaxID=3152361 RepID=UPI003AB5A9F7
MGFIEEERYYITFPALTAVLKAEKCLESSGIKFWLVPIPREITADCGMCIMCYPEATELVKALLAAEDIAYEQTYLLKKRKLKFFQD